MKRFPLILHIVLAGLAIGLAAGLDSENARLYYTYPAIGLAAALGVTAFARILGFLGDL